MASTQHRNEARDVGVLVFGRFLAMLAEAIMPFVIVRLLGKADFGAFTGLLLIYTTLSVILTAGFPAAILYFLAGRSDSERMAISKRLFLSVMGLGGIIGVILYAIGLYGNDALAVLSEWMSGSSGAAEESVDLSYLTFFAILPVFDVLARIFPNFLIAENRARAAAVFGVFRALGISTGTVLPAALGLGVEGIIGGMTTFALLQAVWVGWVFRSQYRGVASEPCQVSVMEMVRFSFPLGLTDIVNNLNAAIDRYAILLLMSAVAFAEYRAGAWQLPITTIAYSVGHVYMPRFVELIRANEGMEVIRLWRESIGKVSLIVIPVCMVFFVGAEEFITLAFTDKYLAAVPVFRLYVLYTMGRVASYGVVILAAGESAQILKASIFTLASNLLLTIPFTIYLGFIGPAVGTVLAFIPSAAVYCYYISRALHIPWNRTFPLVQWLGIVLLGAVAVVPAVAIKFWTPVHPAVALFAYSISTLTAFIVLGRLSGQISGADLQFAADWLKLKILKNPPAQSSDGAA